jgi:hypothetical protein
LGCVPSHPQLLHVLIQRRHGGHDCGAGINVLNKQW